MDNSTLLLISKHRNTVTISPIAICYGHQSSKYRKILEFSISLTSYFSFMKCILYIKHSDTYGMKSNMSPVKYCKRNQNFGTIIARWLLIDGESQLTDGD